MAKKLTFFLFLTILSSFVNATPAYVVFEKTIDGAENFSYIDPITNAQNELSGFIFCDTANNRLIVNEFNRDSLIIIPTEGNPTKAIHYYSESNDTLFVVTTTIENLDDIINNSHIFRYTIANEITKREYGFYGYNFSPFAIKSLKIDHLNIELVKKNNNVYRYLQVEKRQSYSEYFNTIGVVNGTKSYSGVIDLENGDIIFVKNASYIDQGRLRYNDMNDYITVLNDKSHYDSRDFPEDTNLGSTYYNNLNLYDNDNNNILSSDISTFSTTDIYVDNFKPSSSTDEFIFHGYGLDLLNYHDDNQNFIVCYSFSGVFTEELWYNDEVDGINFKHVYKAKDFLVGTRGNNEIVMLNYLNGEISDSTNLERDLTNITFFETGAGVKNLNLVGQEDNKVLVYQFDMSLSVNHSATEVEIPLTFKLFQNHPNPFNGETRIEFEVEETQSMNLGIYNILGQLVKQLTSKTFLPGTYQYYWDGNSTEGFPQSSGIYFARLEGASGSAMIKLIYMK